LQLIIVVDYYISVKTLIKKNPSSYFSLGASCAHWVYG